MNGTAKVKSHFQVKLLLHTISQTYELLSFTDLYAKIRIQRTCFECLLHRVLFGFVLFQFHFSGTAFFRSLSRSHLSARCMRSFRCSFWILHLRLTLTGLAPEITFAAVATHWFFFSLSLIFTPALTVL